METDTIITPNRLRELRIVRGLKQREVASKLGFACSDRISHWEKGQAMPSTVNLFRLAVLFGVLPHDIYPELYEKTTQVLEQ